MLALRALSEAQEPPSEFTNEQLVFKTSFTAEFDGGRYFPTSTREVAINANISEINATPTAKVVKEKPKGNTLCFCVTYAREISGLPIPRVDNAGELKPNSEPRVGGLVLFQYGKTAHVAVITDMGEKGIDISEANFRKCRATKRTISWDDSAIKGFAYY